MSKNISTDSASSDEKSSSPPTDFEFCDYDEDEDLSYDLFKSQKRNKNFDLNGDGGGDGCGTPLNMELAQLLNKGIVSNKLNFGISKNIETLERSTSELQLNLASTSQSASYRRNPELFLRRDDDNYDHDYDQIVNSFINNTSNKTTPNSSGYKNGFGDGEMFFENYSSDNSPNVPFSFIEPNTSYHSACGNDNERFLYEGI